MNIKKSLILPITLIASLASLAGCNKGKNNFAYDLDFNVDVRGQTVKFWGAFGSDINDVFDELLDEFTAKTGINVEYESKGSYGECLKAVTLASSSGAYPHVVVGYPDHFSSYVKSDIIVRLDYYLQNDVHNATFEPEGENFSLNDFYPDYVIENQSIEFDENGNPYTLGIPFNKSTEVMIYNKTFFDWCASQEEYKNTIFVPTTYAEVDSVGKAILNLFDSKNAYNGILYRDGTTTKGSQGDKDIIMDLTGITKPDDSNASTQFRPFSYDSQANLFITTVRQNGGTYTTYDKSTQKGYLGFDSQETRNGLQTIKDMYDDKVFAIPANFGEAKYASNPFKAGHCVMTVGSSAGVKNSAPAGGKFEIAAAAVPFKDASKKYVISQGANLALLDTGSREQRVAAWQLIKFLSKYANGTFCSRTGYYPSCEYAEKANGQGVSGMWAGYDPEEFSDYATWLSEASGSINETDIIKAQTAQVNLEKYVKAGENWTKFVDQPFSGSADVREQVASIVPWVVTGEKTINDAINTVYGVLSDYVRK